MAEFLYYLTILLIKAVVLLFALVAITVSLLLTVPYVLLWPTPDGLTWGQAVRARSWRVTRLNWRIVEFAWTALDTPA